ncbi:MAG: hypothetical protein WAV98_02065 [Minisyncoccia bacterium]
MHTLIGLHAGLGEIGVIASLWVFVELLNMSEASLRRARIAAFIAVIFFISSWLVGGYNYLNDYATMVKPLIKNGPAPWAHLIMTEAKEHLFLFLPFLAIVEWSLLVKYKNELLSDINLRKSALYISFVTTLLAFLMVGMGVLISSGFRAALEALII